MTLIAKAPSDRSPQDDSPAGPSSRPPDRTIGKPFITAALVALLLMSTAAGGMFWFLARMYETLPTIDQLQNIQQSLASKVIARDGSVVHEFSIERRFWASLDQIPKDLRNAVISIEDRRFYDHWGIDLRRIAGAALVNISRGGYAQGASTLTQQLARNLYLTSRQSLVRKIREALTAVQLESYYTKDEILELYLNQVYLGAGVYGVQAASQRYFSKDVSELTLNECTVLAGTIQLPEYYRPDKPKNNARTMRRRRSVLLAMQDMGFLDAQTAGAAMRDSIPSNPPEKTAKTAPYFIELVRQELERRYGDNMLYNGGLTVHTTLDPEAQRTIESAVQAQLDTLQRRCNHIFLDSTRAYVEAGVDKREFIENFDSLYALNEAAYERLPDSIRLRVVQSAVVALDVATGEILALVGGRDFSESKFNRAVQAKRQPGSAIKPIVYTAAIKNGYTPVSVVLDQPITLMTPEGEWRPENYGHKFHGPVTLRHALAKSINLVAIQVYNQVGPMKVITLAREMGLRHRMNPVPALAIGACETTPMEITAAYGIYANHGLKAEPHCITKVYDRNGDLLDEHKPVTERVLSEETAFIMTHMLRDVVLRGTGASIPGRGFQRACAGKTGTTNDYTDAWFVGYTPQIVCGVWVGVDERRSMGYGVTGSHGAIPVWVEAMQALHRDLPRETFQEPDSLRWIEVCDESHKAARKYCPNMSREPMPSEVELDSCDIHVLRRTRRGDQLHRMFGGPQKRRTPKEEERTRRPLMF